mmetsp:Transcript_13975/g.29493  ORF Transcript_13975/g.29493 Transcript_13975/m.29493 type:complete len:253 (-) Transcript_13975:171-929(-)
MALFGSAMRRTVAAGAALAGGAALVMWRRRINPLHVVWDLDSTIICSICPFEKAQLLTLNKHSSCYFDHTDDDFDYVPGEPNTRTCWRPAARGVIRLLSYFATQHIYTAAQRTYTETVLNELDPNRTLFASVIHRDTQHFNGRQRSPLRGKDLTFLFGDDESSLRRVVFFDDRLYNFEPQPSNGVHVRPYNEDVVEFGGDVEMARVLAIAVLAFWAPSDVRPLLRQFQTPRHKCMEAEQQELQAATRAIKTE